MVTTSREGRQGIDLVKDDVEHSLDKELQNIRNYQERMRENLDIAASQLDQNMRRQVPPCTALASQAAKVQPSEGMLA